MSQTGTIEVGTRLAALLAAAELPALDSAILSRFEQYLSLILRWNARINLTAIREEEGILCRHFLESIACAEALPAGITTLLDLGSGAGFPGIPIALCRPEIAITLAESQGKKAAFLNEVVRTLELHAAVHSARAETLSVEFDCVALRAVDRMESAIRTASTLVRPTGWLVLMTTRTDLLSHQAAAGMDFVWRSPRALPGGEERILALGNRASS